MNAKNPISRDSNPGSAQSTKPRANLPTILLLFGLIIALRLPFHPDFLTKWDSCNFAFALEHFNIGVHTPHPPGYPFYVGTAALINWIIGDANLAYILLSMILCSIAAAFIFLTGRLLFGYSVGFFASILFIISPPCWYLSATALSYMSDAALLSAVLYIALLNHRRPDLTWPAKVMPVVLGLGAGFRVPGFILCIPIFLIHLLDLNWAKRLGSILIVLIIIVAGYAWVIQASGGWGEYSRVVTAESAKHGQTFQKLLDQPIRELGRNISRIIMFIRQSLGPLWAVVFIPVLFPRALFSRLTREKLILWAAIAPPVLLFSFVYVNYTAIMLLLLPLISLGVVYGLYKASLWIITLSRGAQDLMENRRHAAVLFTLIWVAVGALAGMQFTHAGNLEQESGDAGELHEYSLSQINDIDNYVRTLIDTAHQYDPDRTVLLMFMEAKHAGYYLRDYLVIWDKYLIRAPTWNPDGIFSLKGGRHIMRKFSSQKLNGSIVFEMPLPEGCSTLIFRGDIQPAYIPGQGLEASLADEDYSLWMISGIPEGSGIIVERPLGTPGGPEPPPPAWTIGPVTGSNM